MTSPDYSALLASLPGVDEDRKDAELIRLYGELDKLRSLLAVYEHTPIRVAWEFQRAAAGLGPRPGATTGEQIMVALAQARAVGQRVSAA